MQPLDAFPNQFVLDGTLHLDACPVCGSANIGMVWQLPQNRLPGKTNLAAPGTHLDGLYLDYLPTLETPQRIFRFDLCGACESLFLNPKADDQAIYVRDQSKVASYRENGTKGMEGTARTCLAELKPDATLVVDMACGAGQVLALMREERPGLRYVGLELSAPSVEFMTAELGLEAHQVDLDRDDLDGMVAPGTADFIVVQEAYEHVRSPVTLLQKAARMLKPGGLIWLTAQFWGDNTLQIRVGEPIYINEKGFRYSIDQAGLHVARLRRDFKVRALLRKPLGDEPAPAFDWAGSLVRAGEKQPKPAAAAAAPYSPVRPQPAKPARPGLLQRLGLGR